MKNLSYLRRLSTKMPVNDVEIKKFIDYNFIFIFHIESIYKTEKTLFFVL